MNIHFDKLELGIHNSNSHCNGLLIFCLENCIVCLVPCLDIYGNNFVHRITEARF